MKIKWSTIKKYCPWLGLTLFFNLLIVFLLWIADIRIFQALSLFLFLVTGLTAAFTILRVNKTDDNRARAVQEFLTAPNKQTEHDLLQAYGSDKQKSTAVRNMILKFYEKQNEIEKLKTRLAEHEDYVELWAHEIKTPLALLTLILDNKKDEWPQEQYFKLDYVRNQIQSYTSQILFYYRLKKEKQDYFFEDIDFKEIVSAVLKDFEPLLQEKNFKVRMKGENGPIHTDARSFEFIVTQIVSNAIKYGGENPELIIRFQTKRKGVEICFKDNGCGVKACDLPHIFNKGFTGDTGPLRKKSTGMGLYLVKQLADKMKIDISTKSVWKEGFEITLYIKSKRTISESKSKIKHSVFFE